jgi:hypothetical protein
MDKRNYGVKENLMDKTKTGKKMAMAIAGAYFLKDITDWHMACLIAGLIAVGILCQTYIDVSRMRNDDASPPIERDPESPG